MARVLILTLASFVLFLGYSSAQLSIGFYSSSCPNLLSIVRSSVLTAVAREARMGASLLRLFSQDCFVNGCDASILLDDTPDFPGEKTADSNVNSARGFEVIDDIKSAVEAVCPGVVSCADILAIAARDAVVSLGGPNWNVQLGRRDARTASLSQANSDIPGPNLTLDQLISRFGALGLSQRHMVALLGAHTIGHARCVTFRDRAYNATNIDPAYAFTLRTRCPDSPGSGDNNLTPLDVVTPNFFDSSYFRNLVQQKGLLQSDQVLFDGGFTDSIVMNYVANPELFRFDFAAAMVRMGNISPLTGSNGEIRTNCRRVN